jgi:hypothetical protein
VKRADTLAFPATAALTAFLLLPLCGVLHRCGCRPPFLGGLSHCNVHRAGEPRCPWCVHPSLGAAVLLPTLAGQWLVLREARKRRLPPLRAALVGVISVPAVVAVVAAVLWLPTDYPHFLAPDVRSRLGLPKGPIVCGPPSPRTPGSAPAPAGGRRTP